MENHKLSVIAAFALVIGACSNVADKNGDVKIADNEGKKISMVSGKVVDPDKVTCKTYKKIGSRISSKHCLTNREWNLRSQRARETTDSIQRQSKQVGDVNGGN